jgi:hypothetical protein
MIMPTLISSIESQGSNAQILIIDITPTYASTPKPELSAQNPIPNFQLYLPSRFEPIVVNLTDPPSIVESDLVAEEIWTGYEGGNRCFYRLAYTAL